MTGAGLDHNIPLDWVYSYQAAQDRGVSRQRDTLRLRPWRRRGWLISLTRCWMSIKKFAPPWQSCQQIFFRISLKWTRSRSARSRIFHLNGLISDRHLALSPQYPVNTQHTQNWSRVLFIKCEYRELSCVDHPRGERSSPRSLCSPHLTPPSNAV